MNPDVPIRKAGERDLEALTGVIAQAFHCLAVAEWLVPDSIEREKMFPNYFRIFVVPAIAHGEVYTVEDLSSVAVWLPATGDTPPPPEDYDERLQAICGPHIDRFRAFDAAMDDHHPHDHHHYLAFLATLPDRQNIGLGIALLREHHRKLDAAGIPAYLEASSERSRDLYLREGYRPQAEPYRLPDGPLMYPLWRHPQS